MRSSFLQLFIDMRDGQLCDLVTAVERQLEGLFTTEAV
jgi:hypothetical protein